MLYDDYWMQPAGMMASWLANQLRVGGAARSTPLAAMQKVSGMTVANSFGSWS